MPNPCTLSVSFEFRTPDPLNCMSPRSVSNKQVGLSNRRKSSVRRNLFPENCPSLYCKTKNVFSSGVNILGKAVRSCKNKIGTLTQKFRFSSFKRYDLEQCNLVQSTFKTPTRRAQAILGRTPVKLYSPFGIETPANF